MATIMRSGRVVLLTLFCMVYFSCGSGDDEETSQNQDSGVTDAGKDDAGKEDSGTEGEGETECNPPEYDFSGFSGKIELPKPIVKDDCDGLKEEGEAVELIPHSGKYAGALQDLKPGDVCAQHFIWFEHPIRIEKIRAYLVGGTGEVEMRLVDDLARSNPITSTMIAEPLTASLDDPKGKWVELELKQPVVVHPKNKFWVVLMQNDTKITLGVDDGSKGTSTDALVYSYDMMIQSQAQGEAFKWFGIGENNQFMVEVIGKYVCKHQGFFFTELGDKVGLPFGFLDMRVAFVDVNNDGYDDLLTNDQTYAPGGGSLFINNKDFTFTDATEEVGLKDAVMQVGIMADIDNDGDEDLYTGVNTPQGDGEDLGYVDRIWLNVGTPDSPKFVEIENSGVEDKYTTTAGSFLDYNRDGCLDLYVGAWLKKYPQPEAMPDRLFKGDCLGTFKDVTVESDIEKLQQPYAPCYGVTCGDYNNDGIMDIFVANYGRVFNFLFTGKEDGTFYEPKNMLPGPEGDDIGPGGNTFGGDFGDFDNDGDLDLFMGEISHPRYLPSSDKSRLLQNNGAPDYTFTDITEQAGFVYDEGEVDPTWIDFDNDGWLDMFIGTLYPGHFARLYQQCAPGVFCDVSYEAGIVAHYSVNNSWSDIDRDGDLDFIVSRVGTGARDMVYRNEIGNKNNWVGFKLIGTKSNRDAIDARIELTAGGFTQLREVKGGKGHFNSQLPFIQHFGLGQATNIDKVLVKWPSGEKSTFTNVIPRHYYLITEGEDDLKYYLCQ